MVGVVRRVAAERDLHALGHQLRQAAVLDGAARALGRGHRAHRGRRARARHQLDLEVVDAEHVRQADVGPEEAQRLEIGRGTRRAVGLIVRARLGAAAEVQRE